MNRNDMFLAHCIAEDLTGIRDDFARIIVGKVIDSDTLSAIMHNQVSGEEVAKAIYFMADALMKARAVEPLKVNPDIGAH